MINVEGDYKEIVQWLDDTKFYKGIQHVESHFGLCFGLYTLVDSVISAKGRWIMNYETVHVEGYRRLTEYEAYNSHLTRF